MLQNINKLKGEGRPFGVKKFCSKKSFRMPKNRKWDSLGFFNIRSVAKHQKIEAGTVWGKTFFEKKSHNSKKEDPLVSPGIVCYAEKEKNPFGSVR